MFEATIKLTEASPFGVATGQWPLVGVTAEKVFQMRYYGTPVVSRSDYLVVQIIRP
jgi:hypothetical protein